MLLLIASESFLRHLEISSSIFSIFFGFKPHRQPEVKAAKMELDENLATLDNDVIQYPKVFSIK